MTRRILILLAATLCYYLAGKLGLSLAFAHSSVSPVWPPTGVAVGAVFVFGYRVLPAIALGAFVLNFETLPWLPALGIAFGNTLEAFVAVWLYRICFPATNWLEGPKEFGWFFLTGTFSCAGTSAVIGVTTLCLSGSAPWSAFGNLWSTWALGDATGLFVIAPFVVALLRSKFSGKPAANLAKDLFVIGLIGFVCQLSFFQPQLKGYGMYFEVLLILPAMMLASFHFRSLGVSGTVALVSLIGVWSTVNGLGPFAQDDKNVVLLTTQLSLGIISLVTLFASSIRTAQIRGESTLLAERDLLKRVIESQEDERRILAHDLHDGFVQYVVGAQSKIEAFTQDTDSETRQESLLDDGVTHLKDAVREARELIGGLRPFLLDEKGVIKAIEHLVNDLGSRNGCRIEPKIDVQFERLNPKLESTLFRIVQESLNNVVQHSEATEASVELRQNNGKLTIRVSDNGIGFNPEKVSPECFGLSGIRERALMYDGVVKVQSRPGEGSIVEARFPLGNLPESDGPGAEDSGR